MIAQLICFYHKKENYPHQKSESEMLNSAEELFEKIDVNRKKIQFF